MAESVVAPVQPGDGTEPSQPQVKAQRDARLGPVLAPWLRAQSVNLTRHAAALRPFQREEFGCGIAAPSEGHIQSVNRMISSLRRTLLKMAKRTTAALDAAGQQPTAPRLQNALLHKERAHHWVQAIEGIWDFYFELFGQRMSMPYAEWLAGCDRIATDCYQAAFTGLGTAKSIPAPAPFCYMRTGFGPATYGRGIRMRRLGQRLNPFPLIQLPYHRLINPWTLGAVLHEVSHNLQRDLDLNRDVPRNVALRLLQAGFPRSVAFIWARWNREMFSDLSALLLGGPCILPSLMDVVGRGPETVLTFNPHGVHPTPYFRTLINVEMLRRMGFGDEAELYPRAWTRIFPNPTAGDIPKLMVRTFPEACRLAVDAMCFRPYRSLGNKSLAEVIRFQPKEQKMIEEGAQRLSTNEDPGIVPARFLIGAARVAFDRRMARPGVVARNFYLRLVRR